jgi:hypothetical protein
MFVAKNSIWQSPYKCLAGLNCEMDGWIVSGLIFNDNFSLG